MTLSGLADHPSTAAARILIIEDEERARSSTSAILRLAGHQTEVASDGREALNRLLAQRDAGELPDVVLLDLQMPYLTGLELLDRLDEEGITLRTIAVTGFGDRHTVLQLMRRGCHDLLDKPIEPEELLARIERVRARRRHPAAASAVTHADAGPLTVVTRRLARDGGEGGDWWGVASDVHHAEVLACDTAGTDPGLRAVLTRAILDESLPRGLGGEALLRLLNRELLVLQDDQAGLAVCALIVDLEAMVLDVVSAGHLPVLFHPRGDTHPRVIEATAANLRRGDRFGFERRRLPISPGDRIALCTDGVVRAKHDLGSGRGPRFGVPALAQSLAEHREDPLADAVEAAWAANEAFCAGHAEDDRLLLAFDIPLVSGLHPIATRP